MEGWARPWGRPLGGAGRERNVRTEAPGLVEGLSQTLSLPGTQAFSLVTRHGSPFTVPPVLETAERL